MAHSKVAGQFLISKWSHKILEEPKRSDEGRDKLSLFGEGDDNTLLADLIWLRTLFYLHQSGHPLEEEGRHLAH